MTIDLDHPCAIFWAAAGACAMNLVEALLEALEERGAGEIFGIPGDFALPFFRIVEESGRLPLFTLSHEPAVGFAADAAARLRGTLGVAAVTYGAGAFNLVNAVAGAYAEKSPVVVISGAPGTHEGRAGLLLHHQGRTLDTQYRVFAEITCAQARLEDAASASAEIARVLDAALAQSRPVYLEIPRDMVGVEVGSVPPLRRPACDAEAVAACAESIMERLAGAKQPVLMVDVEVRRFGLEACVAELARRLAVPVVTTFMGRGLLAGADAPLAGTYLGVAGEPALTDLVEGSDALVLLGVILCDTNFGVSAGASTCAAPCRRSTVRSPWASTSGPASLCPSWSTPSSSAPGCSARREARRRGRRRRAAWRPTRRPSARWTSSVASTISSTGTGPCPSPPTWATACSRRWISSTPISWPRATMPAWASACRRASARSSPPGGARWSWWATAPSR
ncbi:thiamine pyrophosphate-binding protein [Geminicoccaceae bacterium 1502E]|nr:thiamine pyrophosphate-binding protein [Geminicoccaceae bacterium 1502E]